MRTFLLKVTSPVGGSVHVGLLILRVFVGAMMLTHGMAKLLTFTELSLVFPDPLGVGSTMSLLLLLGSEVVCSILLMCGILTRLVVLPSIFGLLVAVFAIHGGDAFAVKEFRFAWYFSCFSAQGQAAESLQADSGSLPEATGGFPFRSPFHTDRFQERRQGALAR